MSVYISLDHVTPEMWDKVFDFLDQQPAPDEQDGNLHEGFDRLARGRDEPRIAGSGLPEPGDRRGRCS
jgi:hypothetical protein